MKIALQDSKLSQIIAFFLSIIPVFIIGVLIAKNGVDFPFGDQWSIATVFEKVYQGKLDFQTFISQHNESRPLFPRLIFVFLSYLTQWDVRYEMLFTFIVACLISFNIYRLNRLSLNSNLLVSLLIFFISNLLIFAPIQYESWLWGIQLIVFIPIFCITTCIIICYSGFNLKTKFLMCAFLSTVSTFSCANGMVAWVVVFPVLSLSISWKRNDIFKQKTLLFGWLSCFIINMIVYFHDYQKPPTHPSFLYALLHPLQALNFFLAFLGAPFAFGIFHSSIIVATVVGSMLVILFIASNVYLLHLDNASLLYKSIAWQAIGVYVVISALITTLGRVGFGVNYSLSLRYTTYSLYLPIALIYLISIVLTDIQNKDYFQNKKLVIKIALNFLLISFLILHSATSIFAMGEIRNLKWKFLHGKACLLLINFIEDECLIQDVYPDNAENLKFRANFLKSKANFLDKIGFLHPNLLKTRIMEDTARDVKLSSEIGWFDTLKKIDEDTYLASGWAILPDRKDSYDAVLLTYENNTGKSTAFTITDTRIERPDVAKVLKSDAYLYSGWRKTFSKKKISSTGSFVKIAAWAFDTDTGKAFKINGAKTLQKL